MAGRTSQAAHFAADRARALALTPVSRETATRLDAFIALLLKWQATTNLIAPSTLPEIWTRHVADSLQLVPLAPDARVWVDLGSGGGFPGLAIACALAETGGTVHLVESNAKKAAFLREGVRKIDVPALVHAQRIEDFVHSQLGPVDMVTARALAPLSGLLGYAEPLLKNGAQALFLKGQDVETELTEAARYWKIAADLIPSRTASSGRIVAVRAARRC
jgi:16S rRNA (guanine527-N7)-methyltransferase